MAQSYKKQNVLVSIHFIPGRKVSVLKALAACDGGFSVDRAKTRIMQLAGPVCSFPLNGCLSPAILYCNCHVWEVDSPKRLIYFKFNRSREATERLTRGWGGKRTLCTLDFFKPKKNNTVCICINLRHFLGIAPGKYFYPMLPYIYL